MASTYLTYTQGPPTNNRKWTISYWAKYNLTNNDWYPTFGSDYDTGESYFGIGSGGQGRNEIGFIEYHGAVNYGQGYTASSLRDSSAWYHIVFAYDSTQSTASDRGKTYINGVQQTNTYSTNIPQNHESRFNFNNSVISIGRRSHGSGQYMDGLLSHFHFIDGTAYDASTFGETDSTTGIWKPKTAPSVTYGNNGFFLKFENSSSMGTDSSGNSNNLTVGGGTMTQTIDTPSNVFATLNPLDTGLPGNTINLANGNNTTMNKSGWGDYGLRSTLGMSKGKYYWECKLNYSGNGSNTLGILKMDKRLVINLMANPATADVFGIQRYSDSTTNIYNDGTFISQNSTMWGGITSSDVIGFALDMDNGKLFLSKNGAFKDSSGNTGDPVNGTNPTFTGIDSNEYYAFYSEMRMNIDNGTQVNFGNGYFGTTAVSSAQNPDDGIGIFEYDVPAGYRALCTKSINAQEYS
jgi:hypothetical protein